MTCLTVQAFSIHCACIYKSFTYIHILCVIQVNDSRCNSSLGVAVPESCGNIQLTPAWFGVGNTVKGYAEFAGPTLKGNIIFVSRKFC